MPAIILNKIANDNIITKNEYYQTLTITGTVTDIPDGQTITLELDGKTIESSSIYLSEYQFEIPSMFLATSNELYLQQLSNNTPYVVKLFVTNTPTIELYSSIFVNIVDTVMSYDEFMNGSQDHMYLGLPQDGDTIDAEHVNRGAIQNRIDILHIDEKIGNLQSELVDVTAENYDPNADNDLSSPNANIVSAISQLRVDVGNKALLTTKTKTSLVTAINEIKGELYKPSQALNLVADYDFNTHGNYVLSGGDVSYINTMSADQLPSNKDLAKVQPFIASRYSGNYPTTSMVYNHFRLEPSKVMINGYEVRLPKALDFYFQDTMTDEQPDHGIQYEDDMRVKYFGMKNNYMYYKVPYGAGYLTGIKDITTIQGNKVHSADFTFTITGATQQLNTQLLSEIATVDLIQFSSAKLVSIPSQVVVNGVTRNCTLSVNGDSIIWNNYDPSMAGHACTISQGSLTYNATLQDDNLLNNVGVTTDKTTILVKSNINFSTPSIEVTFNRILPRYDRIYMGVSHTDYDARVWESTESYERNDIVSWNGYNYKALMDNTNVQPNLYLTEWQNLGIVDNGISLKPSFLYIEGKNNDEGYPVPPTFNDQNYILMATIFNSYGYVPKMTKEYVKTYKMSDIKKLEDILHDSTYNLARLISTQNLSVNDASLTRNMYIDPFFDENSRDTHLELSHVGDGENPKSMLINEGLLSHHIIFKEAIETMNMVTTSYVQLNVVETGALVEQPKYTHSVLVNKYQVTAQPKVTITVSPQTYTWFDEIQNNTFYERRTATLNGSTVNWDSVSALSVGTSTTAWNSEKVGRWGRLWSRDKYNVKETSAKRTDILSSIIKEPRVVPEYTLTIKAPASSFNGKEQVRIKIDDLPEIYGTNSVATYAAYDGSLNISFPIGGTAVPMKSGDRIIAVEGIGRPGLAGDYISGARGVSTISQVPYLKIINNYDIVHRDVAKTHEIYNPDPLAQTFVINKDTYAHSVYVMIDAQTVALDVEASELQENINNTTLVGGVLPEDLELTLFETTAGYPDHEKVLATGVLPKGTIIHQGTKSGSTAPQYNQIELFPKVKLEKNKTYSFCVAGPYETHGRKTNTNANTDDWLVTVGQAGVRLKLRAAKLGYKYPYPGTKNTLVNEQPYVEGIMLSSSNKVTWTPHQDQDLTFKITECKFNAAPKTVNFDVNTESFTDVTDVIFQVGASAPEGTKITHSIKYGDTLQNTLSINNGEHKILPSKIASITKHQIQNVLSSQQTKDGMGNVSDSPILYKESSIYFGTVASTSVYVTKNIDLSYGVPFAENKKLRLYLDVYGNTDVAPDMSRVKVYYTTDAVISDSSWHLMYRDASYASMIQEHLWETDAAIPLGDNLRIKIVLITNIADNTQITNRIGMENLRVYAF
jgi:hypothetical protein